MRHLFKKEEVLMVYNNDLKNLLINVFSGLNSQPETLSLNTVSAIQMQFRNHNGQPFAVVTQSDGTQHRCFMSFEVLQEQVANSNLRFIFAQRAGDTEGLHIINEALSSPVMPEDESDLAMLSVQGTRDLFYPLNSDRAPCIHKTYIETKL